jgi:hypothetical protein
MGILRKASLNANMINAEQRPLHSIISVDVDNPPNGKLRLSPFSYQPTFPVLMLICVVFLLVQPSGRVVTVVEQHDQQHLLPQNLIRVAEKLLLVLGLPLCPRPGRLGRGCHAFVEDSVLAVHVSGILVRVQAIRLRDAEDSENDPDVARRYYELVGFLHEGYGGGLHEPHC